MRAHFIAVLAAATISSTSILASAAGAGGQTSPTATSASAPVARAVALAATGAPWLRIGRVALPQAAPREPRMRARMALSVAVPAAAALDVVATAVDTFGDGDTIVRFGQLHRGLPVVGSGAAVRLDARGEVVMSTALLASANELPASVVPTLARGAAAAIAQKLTPVRVRDADAKLAVARTREGSFLVWVFVPAVPRGLATAPRILVDAQTGDVIESVDMAKFATAKMYPSNPKKSPTLASLTLPMAPTDPAGKLVNDFVVSLNCAGDGVVKDLDFQGFPLKIRACELSQTALPTAAGVYDYTPIDDVTKKSESASDSFSEVSMYYHATNIYSYFRGLQGDPNAQVVLEKPLRAVSNLRLDSALASGNIQGLPGPELLPVSNAFYSPGGAGLGDAFAQLYGFNEGSMWFFQGPRRDYAYDGDVVYHEFVHAVVNATLQLEAWHLDKYGMVASPGGMNEGLSDYFSSALTGDPDVGEYASGDVDQFTGGVIRTLKNDDKCPTAVVGQVHHDSTLFSGAMWTARVSLASDTDRTKFDAAIYKAMRTTAKTGDLGYEDVAQLFLATLRTDFAAGAAALEKAYTDRGVLPECSRIFTYAGEPIGAPKGSGFPGLVAPGSQSLGRSATIVPGVVQAKVALPAGTEKLEVTFKVPQAQGGGMGGVLGGGGGTAFKPMVLVKWGEAVTWTTTGKLTSNADIALAAEKGEGTAYALTVDVPAGTALAAVQIGNGGSQDGSYTALTLTPQGAPPPDPATAPGPSGTGTPVASTPVTAAPPETVSAGCGCAVPASQTTSRGLALAALGALALVFRRKRRD